MSFNACKDQYGIVHGLVRITQTWCGVYRMHGLERLSWPLTYDPTITCFICLVNMNRRQ